MVCHICETPASACCAGCHRYMCTAHTCNDYYGAISCRKCYPEEVEKTNEAARIEVHKRANEDYERRKRRFFLW
jgi:hypothetical protein